MPLAGSFACPAPSAKCPLLGLGHLHRVLRFLRRAVCPNADPPSPRTWWTRRQLWQWLGILFVVDFGGGDPDLWPGTCIRSTYGRPPSTSPASRSTAVHQCRAALSMSSVLLYGLGPPLFTYGLAIYLVAFRCCATPASQHRGRLADLNRALTHRPPSRWKCVPVAITIRDLVTPVLDLTIKLGLAQVGDRGQSRTPIRIATTGRSALIGLKTVCDRRCVASGRNTTRPAGRNSRNSRRAAWFAFPAGCFFLQAFTRSRSEWQGRKAFFLALNKPGLLNIV